MTTSVDQLAADYAALKDTIDAVVKNETDQLAAAQAQIADLKSQLAAAGLDASKLDAVDASIQSTMTNLKALLPAVAPPPTVSSGQ